MISAGIATRRSLWTVLGVLAVAAAPLSAGRAKRPELDVPYVPTHRQAVEQMLQLAGVTEKDYVIDLGCGDGRIVVIAAKKYKARGLGVDLDPRRIRQSKQNVKKAGVGELVEIREGNALKTDVSKATVVTLFLLETVNVQLRPTLFAQLQPGSRVVSNSFTMGDWKADKKLQHDKAYSKVIYFWVIPAPAAGTWTWQTKLGDKQQPGCLKLEQEFQAVQGTLACDGGAAVPVAKASLVGRKLSFNAKLRASEEVEVAFEGVVEGDAIRGTQKWSSGPGAGTHPWVAKRTPVDLAGRWQIRSPSQPSDNGTLHIRRDAGKLKAFYVRDAEPDKECPLPGFYVWGSSVRFDVPSDGLALAFSGSLGPDGGGGRVGHEESEAGDRKTWSAKRLTGK
jgi:precorrin-6B methylase 2